MNIIFLLIGIALFATGALLFFKNKKLSKEGISMQAEIIEVKKKEQTNSDADGYSTTSDMYYPVYRYTYEGKEYVKESNVGVSNSKKYVKGGKVDVVFMPDTPDKAKMKGFMGQYFIPVLLFIIGFIFIVVSFIV